MSAEGETGDLGMGELSSMCCDLTEEELWSGLDRNALDVQEHVGNCPTCQKRVAALEATTKAVASAATPQAPPLPEKVGAYRILRRLGQGGMGIVYEGEQQTPKRLVAIKVVRGGKFVDEYRVRLFQREAQTLARLRHPAIAAIYEAGRTDDGEHFFAMELVRGIPLNQYARQHDLLRRDRLALFRRICDAINYAHQRGVIHRDLKPSNILVDPEGHPRILDFGLARMTDPEAPTATAGTTVGQIMGTLPYMSPEEAQGDLDGIDVRSDVYSLGVIFYELITDQLPYVVRRAALHEAVRVICEEPPRRPSTIERSLRGDLETIALKALEKDRARRYQSAAAFSDDVMRYLTDQPILARPAGVSYRFRKFVVRHKVFFVFLIALFAVVGAAASVVLTSARALEETQNLHAGLQDRRVAIIEQRLADEYHVGGKLPQAEAHYRRALATFERLEVDRSTVDVSLELASLLIARLDSEDPLRRTQLFADAAELIRNARKITERNPSAWDQQRERAVDVSLRLAETAMSRAETESLDEGESLLLQVEDFLWEMVDSLASSQTPAVGAERRALEALKRLYRPKLLDAPAALEDVEHELRRGAEGGSDAENAPDGT